MACDLEVDSIVCGKKVIDMEDAGERTVYTPVEVDGHHYSTINGLEHKNCSFIGSTSTLLSSEALDRLSAIDPIGHKYGYDLRIYEEPIEGMLYLLGCDCSAGVGADYSTIQVLKVVNRYQLEQVAVFANNNLKPTEFAEIIDSVDRYYNNAPVIIESNDCGTLVINELIYNIGNENLVYTDKKGLGTKANHTSKLNACMELKKYCEKNWLKINDNDTIHELARFEQVSIGVFKGAKGGHDDLVSSLYWAVYITTQPQIDLDHGAMNDRYSSYTDDEAMPLMFDGVDMSSDDFWSDFD